MKISGTDLKFNFGDIVVHIPTGTVFPVSKIRVINEDVLYGGDIITGWKAQVELEFEASK